MSKDAIKGVHGRLQHFGPRDTQSYFPWSEFVDYDNQQVAAGQPSMIVTATYQGKKRQLYFSYNNSVDPAFAFMAVNVRDERFIQFFYDMYWLGTVRVPGLNNQWLGLDNCAFSYANYGVVDDSGNWVNGVTWDPPYPQNDDEWVAAIVKILSELHAKDPSLRFIANGPDAATDAKFNQIAAQLDGFIYEDFLGDYNASPYGAQDLYKKFTRLQSVLFDKVQIYQPRGSDPAAVASAFLAYAIFTGPKGYYGMLDGQSVEADPSIWQPIRRALGQPTALGVADGQNGWRLYHREFEHGLAYFNWTGAAKTVTLPPGRTYFDKTGAKVTQLSLQYKEGAYVTF
ncbi:MAG: hypothetical protein JOZ53_26395 [Planctomycetaceae bacterium]|nr:hypothetical protein [Planctomycetaceae bacterium]